MGVSAPCSIFQIIPWNWKHLTNCKVQGKKVIWHMILHSYLCNALCKVFIKIENKYVFTKAKARERSNQARKKLFCHVIVRNYLGNVSWKFLIKIECTWRREIKEQAPQLSLLYRGRTVRSSHWRCCIRKLFLKILQYPHEPTHGSSFCF